MVWQRLLGSGPLALLAYLTVNTLVVVINPAKFVTQTTDFMGAPTGDRSDEVRLYLANQTNLVSNVTWELDKAVCGFSYYWNTLTGALGNRYDQDENLCVRSSSIDWYSMEGVDILSPEGMELDCGESKEVGVLYTFRYCDAISESTSHVFDMTGNLTWLGLPESASATDVELLFSTGSLAGVYQLSDPIFVCDEPIEWSVHCTLQFVFYDENPTSSESRNSTVGVRSAILDELIGLAGSDWLSGDLSKAGMEDGICDLLASTEELLDCSIVCNASYPYPSSSCVGTYESLLVKEVTHKLEIVSVMTAITVACWLLLSTLRLGMRTPNGRSRRGYLGAGGLSQQFFEEEGDQGDRISLANPIPPMQVARVGTQGTTICSFSGSGFPIAVQRGGENIAGLGIVVCPGVEDIPREALLRTGPPVALGDPKFAGSSRSRPDVRLNSGTVPICFIVGEDPDGYLKNLDVEEVHRLLDKSGGQALLDESFGGDHLAWARGFSVVDAVGCLLTLWTVHFVAANSGWGSFYWVAALVAFAKWLEESDVKNIVGPLLLGVPTTPKLRTWSAPPLPITLAAMEVLYDLSVPGVEVIGLIATAIWTLIVVVSCGYFIFVLGYEPVYAGGGLYSSKVSLKTALAVGGALNCPFALAGEWVRGSRCGDIGGRLAVSFCLASPETPDGTRVSHVNFRSELRSTLETGILCGDGDGAGRPITVTSARVLRKRSIAGF
ncbi:unnamed protein product [Pylaiella littoralis]